MASKNSASGAKNRSRGTAEGKKPAAAPKAPDRRDESKAPRPIRREIGAVVCALLAFFTLLSCFKVEALFLDVLSGVLRGLFGWGLYLVPAALFIMTFTLVFHRGRPVILRLVCAALLPLIFGAMGHLVLCRVNYELSGGFVKLVFALYSGGKDMVCGGLLSGLFAIGLEAMFSIYGAFPVLLVAFIVALMRSVNLTFTKLLAWYRGREIPKYEPEPEPEPAPIPESKPIKQPKEPKRRQRKVIDIPLDDEEENLPYEPLPTEPYNGQHAVNAPQPEPVSEPVFEKPAAKPRREREEKSETREETKPAKVGFFGRLAKQIQPEPEPEELPMETPITPMSLTPEAQAGFREPEIMHISIPEIRSAEPVRDTPTIPAPVIPEAPAITKLSREELSAAEEDTAGADSDVPFELAGGIEAEIDMSGVSGAEYVYPPVDLLRRGAAPSADGRDEIKLNRDRLETTLKSFGVAANIVSVTRGPTVTRYDLELDAGVKLTKITNLANDLALSLGVMNVRIAPIPDKISTVGIEVPNKIVSIVYLRDIVESANFKNAASSLSFAIGKDIGGDCVVGNIAKLPHMLIAGTTGSGKSVCINSLLLSLLYKSSPEQVRLIMIDPKMVELGIYNGIPHLLVPVVTDPKKAAGALQWAVVEMLKRYRLFSEVGVRDLAGYNAHQRKVGAETMPQIVIVVDELADLMLVASKDVEESICRVAQMGRASGMHLVIATQRPSADVITGLMKANIPSRIAFAVSSAMESRIILDSAGAEKLIGMGDMLYSPLGSGKPIRVQGAFVSDEEREDVIDFIKGSSAAEYSDDVIAQIDKAAEDKNSGGGSNKTAEEPPEEAGFQSNYDELLPQAVDVIFETKQASVSMLQRRLKLGYSRAARLVDQMEELGIVGPFEGSKPRQVLITKQQWQEMQLLNGTAPTERFTTEMEFDSDM